MEFLCLSLMSKDVVRVNNRSLSVVCIVSRLSGESILNDPFLLVAKDMIVFDLSRSNYFPYGFESFL